MCDFSVLLPDKFTVCVYCVCLCYSVPTYQLYQGGKSGLQKTQKIKEKEIRDIESLKLFAVFQLTLQNSFKCFHTDLCERTQNMLN